MLAMAELAEATRLDSAEAAAVATEATAKGCLLVLLAFGPRYKSEMMYFWNLPDATSDDTLPAALAALALNADAWLARTLEILGA